jgi:hypothetical protein
MNTMNTVDIDLSLRSRRNGGDLVEATGALAGVRGVANTVITAAQSQGRMDATGALRYTGLRGLIGSYLTRAAGAGMVRLDGGVKEIDDIMRKLGNARRAMNVAGETGRLDDASIGLVGSDRVDSFNPSAALALARELEYVTNEVLREERPVYSAKRLFSVDSSMPAGARSYIIRRMRSSGQMKFWRAGEGIPLVDVGRDEKSMTIAHACIGMQTEFFEQQSDAYAGINSFAEKVRAAAEATEEFENDVFWNGAESHKLYGLLTFPWLLRVKLPNALAIPTSDSAFEQQAQNLADMINDIMDRNVGATVRLRVIMSPRIRRQLAQSHSPSTQRSLLDRFLADNPSVVGVEEAPELQGTGPGGASQDGILVVPEGAMGPVLVQPVGFSLLPVHTSEFGLTQTQAGYIAIGGARYKEALRSTLHWVDIA